MMRFTGKRMSIQDHLVSSLALSLFLLTVCGLSTNGATIVTDGLVHYWTFDKDTINGKQIKDVWGKRNGIIVGEPKIVAGWVREGLQFDGKDDYVNITNLGDFGSKLGSSTFEAWMKTDFNKEWVTLFKVLDEGCNMGWAIEINRSALAGFPFKKNAHHFYIRDATGGCKAIAAETETILSDGKWHHVAWVVEQAEKNRVQIYIDGQSSEVKIGQEKGPSKFINFKEPVFVGGGNNRGKLARPFPGTLDEIRIYNRPLNAAEVKRNYQSKLGLRAEAALKLPVHWANIRWVLN